MDRRSAAPYLFIGIIGLAVAYFLINSGFSFGAAGMLVFLLIVIPTLINPNIGLAIIIIAVMYSPEFVAGQTRGRAVSIRTEDVLMMVIIFAWLVKASFTKNIEAAFKTRITAPFFLYIGVCVLSTMFAAMAGSKIDLRQSFFTILKYFEYFLLFIMVRDNVKNMRQVKFFTALFLLTALFTALNANAYISGQLERGVTFFRASAPAMTGAAGSEPGTMGGYLVFMMALAGGLLVYTCSVPLGVFLICLELVMFRAFLYTLSRGSYLAFIPALIALAYFTRKNRLTLAYILGALAVLFILFAPLMVRDRVVSTIVTKEDASGTRIELEASPRSRVESWNMVLFEKFPRSPLIGHGVARSFIDGQMFLTLCEVGLAGLFLLVWIFARLFKSMRDVLALDIVKDDDLSVGLALGALSGFIGLIAHSLSTNTFIVIKTMEPFWFMAAIVLSLPKLLEEEKTAKEAMNTFVG